MPSGHHARIAERIAPQRTPKTRRAAIGLRMSASSHVDTRSIMPEDERLGLYDAAEECPWDCDLDYPLDPGDDDDEDEDE